MNRGKMKPMSVLARFPYGSWSRAVSIRPTQQLKTESARRLRIALANRNVSVSIAQKAHKDGTNRYQALASPNRFSALHTAARALAGPPAAIRMVTP
jgi:hypothetical protein